MVSGPITSIVGEKVGTRCLEVLGTKVTGMVRAEHSGVRQKVKDPANTGGGAHYSCLQVAALILLMGAGTGEMFAAPLSTFSHTIPATKRNTF